MLTYSFIDIGKECLYEHLYKCIKNDIISGRLSPDTKLPSKRSFAKNLGVSTITVETAYSQLASEGYIYSLPKKGFYVSSLKVNGIKISSVQRADTEISHPKDKPAFVADFKSNRTRPENFPFSVWTRLMRETMSEHEEELMNHSPGAGIYELREAIADYLQDFRGMNVSPEQIVIGAGTEYLYGLLIQLLGRDLTYAVEDPSYQVISLVYNSFGLHVRHIPLDDDGPDMDILEKSGANILHISPSHHYPTGQVTPISRRYELLGWCAKDDSRYIIEDDYDSELRFHGKPIPPLQNMDVNEHTIYINTFSKSLTSTIRISYMVLPKMLMRRYQKQLGFYSCTVSNFEQFTLARFIKEGYFEKHINRMRNFYRRQRDLLVECIKKSPLSTLSEITEEDSGLHFLLKLHTDLDDDEISRRALKKGLRLAFLGDYFYHRPKEASHILVINYSGLKPENMEQAIKILYQCL